MPVRCAAGAFATPAWAWNHSERELPASVQNSGWRARAVVRDSGTCKQLLLFRLESLGGDGISGPDFVLVPLANRFETEAVQCGWTHAIQSLKVLGRPIALILP